MHNTLMNGALRSVSAQFQGKINYTKGEQIADSMTLPIYG